ncbi:MAG TPA: 50S ribosomal protein L11 methyltransferase [Ktedonobacterales bacterium]|nr:50S ribosomal protein L11 methyltransferase [Ktedonobacterales bacterium]
MSAIWLEMCVRAAPETVEAISELMSRYVAGGVAIEEPYQLLDDGQAHLPIPGAHVTIRAYVPDDADGAESQRHIEEGLWHLGQVMAGSIGELETRQIAEEDWANAWKEYYHVLHLGRRTVIKPSWREYTPRENEVVVELDPGMAFGTGLHPTTRNCLLALEDTIHEGNTVLDAGTGSGILAISAIKLGAAKVLALDVSAVAAAAARENAASNGVSEVMEVRLATLEGADGEPFSPLPDGIDTLGPEIGVFDVVVTNIIARVIAQLAPALVRATRPGGTLIASGIIAERRAEAEEPLRAAGLQDIRDLVEGDWVTLIGTRPVAAEEN